MAARLTAVPGASQVLERGLVTYSNAAKCELLGVPPELIAEHGAVSEPVARAMARGARERAGVAVGAAITGIAGPDGGTPEKPVGTVFLALDGQLGGRVRQAHFPGDRERVRQHSSQALLEMLRRAPALEGLSRSSCPPRQQGPSAPSWRWSCRARPGARPSTRSSRCGRACPACAGPPPRACT